MHASFRALSFAVASLAALLSPADTSAQTFTLIADSSVAAPFGTNFYMVAPPAVSGSQVLFGSTVSGAVGGDSGLFLGAPTSYQTVAREDDLVVGTTSTIAGFSSYVIAADDALPVFDSTGRIACQISCNAGGGLASWSNGAMEGAITSFNGVPIPGGTGTFATFGLPVMDGGVIAFSGGNTSTGELGVYTSSTIALELIADKGTPIPNGTGTFTNFFTRSSIHGGTVAFLGQGTGGQSGMYTSTGGVLSRVADTSTPVPGGTGNFTGFLWPVITSSGASFVGFWDGGTQSGVYTTIGGALTKVVDSQTSYAGLAGGTYDFRPLNEMFGTWLAGSGGRLAFLAKSSDFSSPYGPGLFVWDASGVTKLVEGGEDFEGGYVYWPDMGPQAVDGNKVGFKVTTQAGGGYRDFLATFPASTAAQDWGLYE